MTVSNAINARLLPAEFGISRRSKANVKAATRSMPPSIQGFLLVQAANSVLLVIKILAKTWSVVPISMHR